MKKKLILFYTSLMTVALLLTACAEGVDEENKKQTTPSTANGKIAVGFEAYNSRGVTRGGWAGTLDLNQLKESEANGGGFGVFAYYTDLKKYDQTYVPNFMYNQGVFWDPVLGIFDYTPTMYWPNEYGSDAYSDDEDHLTFFAYAPFVENASAAAGSVVDATYGITGFSRNTASGDPLVKYIASFEPAKSVDLCWGVVPNDKTAWPRIHNGSTQTLNEGLPWLDVYRPLEAASKIAATTSRVKFKFNHALAQLNVQIDTDADVTTHQDGVDPDLLGAETKVYVRSISFTGIALKGALNLNNTVPNQALWLDYSGMTDLSYGQSVVLHDGRRDGREGVLGAEAPNELPQGLNPNIIQNSTSTIGVTPTYQNLFKPTSSDPSVALNEAVCVIPTGEAMNISIVYDVETINPDLTTYISDGVTHGMSIENKVTKTVTFGGVYGAGLESNKRYTLKLHLGMNSVKFDADVSDWAENTVNGDVWLPSNTRPILLNKTVMYLGTAQTLTATTDPLGQAVIWDNTDGGIATLPGMTSTGAQHIDASYVNNTITITPVALGTTTVTASLASGDKATCEVHVVPVTITSQRTSPPVKTKGPDIAIRDTLLKTFTADLTPVCFGSTGVPPVNWTVSPAGVVSLSVNPTTQVCTVTALANGTATVTCTNTGYTSMPATYTVVVQTLTPTVTAPTLAPGWTYDAAAHDLLATAGSVTGGTMYYSPDNTNWYTSFTDAALQATNAGSYPVYYKVTGDPGYADVPSTPIGTVMVAKATPTITLSATSGDVYERDRITTFTATTSSAGDGATLSVSSAGNATATISSGTVTVKGSAVGSATVTVTSSPSPNYNGTTATFSATIKPLTADMNPLYYVAPYNMTGTNTMGVADSDGAHWTWSGAMTNFAASTTAYTNYQNASKTITGESGTYHLPVRGEWVSIMPAFTSGENLLTTTTGTTRNSNVVFGFDANTKAGFSETSYIVKVSNTEWHVLRYLGSDYCSAWKYELQGTTGVDLKLVISSTFIDRIEQANAASWYAANWGTLTFSEPLSQTRTFYTCGWSSPVQDANAAGYYWGASLSPSSSLYYCELLIDANDIHIAHDVNNAITQFTVRLFKDN